MTDAGTASARTAGPPRFFALLATPGGVVLAGSCGRGVTRSADSGATWQPLGKGPGSEVVHAFAASRAGDVLAATAGTGVHRSGDGGLTWEPMGLAGTTVHAVAEVGPVILAGTDGDGVWQSGDGGSHWEQVPGFRPGATVFRIVPRAGGADLATADAVWRYEDGRVRRSGLRGAVVYALLALDDTRLLAGTRGDGAFRSSDGGRTWERANAGLPDTVVHALAASDRGDVYAGTGLGVARTADGGRSWETVGCALAHHRIFSLAAGAEAGLLAGSYEGVWVLPPAATEWRPLDVGVRADDALALLVEPHGRVFAATSGGGRRSDDGGDTWTVAGPPVGEQTTYAFARVSSGLLLAGTNDGIAASDDDGRSWRPLGMSGERVYRIVEVEPGVVLAGTLGGGLWRGDGLDADWHRAAGVTHPSVFDVRRAADGALLAATGVVDGGVKSGGIFRSTDGGTTWQPADCPPITVYRIVATGGDMLYAGAQRSRILRSTDDGRTWTFLPDTTGLVDAKLFALWLDPRDRIYLGAGAHLLRSADGAGTWQQVGDGLDGASVFDVARPAEGVLLAATAWGVYRSADDGLTWQPTARPSP